MSKYAFEELYVRWLTIPWVPMRLLRVGGKYVIAIGRMWMAPDMARNICDKLCNLTNFNPQKINVAESLWLDIDQSNINITKRTLDGEQKITVPVDHLYQLTGRLEQLFRTYDDIKHLY